MRRSIDHQLRSPDPGRVLFRSRIAVAVLHTRQAVSVLFVLWLSLTGPRAQAQCYGTTQFPAGIVVPNSDGEPTIISPVSWAGDYALVSVQGGGSYLFTSSDTTDHITVSTAPGSGDEAFGTQPLLYHASYDQTVYVHVHTDPACGTDPTARITQVRRMICTPNTTCDFVIARITNVQCGTIMNSSGGCGDDGYSDFTAMVTDVEAGVPLPIVVSTTGGDPGEFLLAKMNWNRDLDFDDALETIGLTSTDGSTWTGTILCPTDAAAGNVLLRVVSGGYGDNCAVSVFHGVMEDYTLNIVNNSGDRFDGGFGRGDALLSFPNPGIVDLPFTGGRGRGDRSLTFAAQVPEAYFLAARTILGGPYNSSLGLMTDALRATPGFPTTEPYTALGYAHVGGGGETVDPTVLNGYGSDAIVDWVLLEMRNSSDPSQIAGSRCALLQRDGDVVDVDGSSPVLIDLAPGDYHVAVRHRNHLGCMTATALPFGLTPLQVDFTSPATATYGTQARRSITGAYPAQVLWSGDVTFNAAVKYTGSGNDRDPILLNVGSTTPNNVVGNTYSAGDVNMDGQVKYTGSGNDRDPILINVGSTTPNNVRTEQLP